MICKDCIKKDVCKHYIYLKEYDGLKLKECNYKFSIEVSDMESKYIESNIMLLNSKESKENVIEKIQEINKANLSLEKSTQDFKLVSKPSKLIECPSCNSNIYPEDLISCNKCEKEICPVCGFQTYDCNKDEYINLCDNCWNEN